MLRKRYNTLLAYKQTKLANAVRDRAEQKACRFRQQHKSICAGPDSEY